jgi:hypothetical protein
MATYELMHWGGCDQSVTTRIAQYTGIATEQECANMCAAEMSQCDFFIFGIEGTEKEGYCRLEAGECVAKDTWTTWYTYKILSSGQVVKKTDARFDILHENGCEDQDAVTDSKYATTLDGCATDCEASATCSFFLYGKTGFSKEGYCQLGNGNGDCSCGSKGEGKCGKGSWRSYIMVSTPPAAPDSVLDDTCITDRSSNVNGGEDLAGCEATGGEDIRYDEAKIALCVAECCGMPDCVGLVMSQWGTMLKKTNSGLEVSEGHTYISVELPMTSSLAVVTAGCLEIYGNVCDHEVTATAAPRSIMLLAVGGMGCSMVAVFGVMLFRKRNTIDKYEKTYAVVMDEEMMVAKNDEMATKGEGVALI